MQKTSISPLLAGLFLFSACAFGTSSAPARVDEARLARLPADERAQLVDQQRQVDIAQSNLETAKVAYNDAKQFLSIVENEHNAAHERFVGTKKNLDLTAKTAGQDPSPMADAQREMAIAGQRMDAANAKMQYAHNLVDLRASQVELRKAEVDLANSNVQLARFDRLQAHNQAPDLRRDDFVAAHDKAQSAVTSRKSDIGSRRGTVQASQQQWNELHQKFDVAAQTQTPSDAPPPPQPID
jgi:hypothetical protein